MSDIIPLDSVNAMLKMRSKVLGVQTIQEIVSEILQTFNHLFREMPLNEPINISLLGTEIKKHYSIETVKIKIDVSILYWLGCNKLCVRFENNYFHPNRKIVFMCPVYLLNMMKSLEIKDIFGVKK